MKRRAKLNHVGARLRRDASLVTEPGASRQLLYLAARFCSEDPLLPEEFAAQLANVVKDLPSRLFPAFMTSFRSDVFFEHKARATRIARWLDETSSTVGKGEIMKRAGLTPQAFRGVIEFLLRNGYVTEVDRGGGRPLGYKGTGWSRNAAPGPSDLSMFERRQAPSRSRELEEAHGSVVYVATNPAWPDWTKVGFSTNWLARKSGYDTSSPHRDYEVHAVVNRPDARLIEARTCDILADKFDRGAGIEWFKCTRPDAEAAIHVACREADGHASST